MLTVGGCSGLGAAPNAPPAAISETSGSDTQRSTATSGSSPAAVRVVEESQADLYLWVSNQSFKDDPVVLKVSIDGTEVIAQPFEVEGHHNWILFPLQVSPGRHMLSVTSETGARMFKHFTLPRAACGTPSSISGTIRMPPVDTSLGTSNPTRWASLRRRSSPSLGTTYSTSLANYGRNQSPS
jgi:hypothetical protein